MTDRLESSQSASLGVSDVALSSKQKSAGRREYSEALKRFDANVCEASAVGQDCANRLETAAIGYSTYVFSRMCAHAQALICAAPLSRWTRREFERWDIAAVAPHARSILEGYVLFRYLADAPSSLDVQRDYINAIHLYDCKKRISILPTILSEADIEWLKEQEKEISSRLLTSEYFQSLNEKAKKTVLAGDRMTLPSKEDVILSAGIEKDEYDFYFNYLSQNSHVFSFSFHRMEPNGRGTGIENDFDRAAIFMVLNFCSGLLGDAVDRLVSLFPDSAEVRKGIESRFSPGPIKNLPKHVKRAIRRKHR